MESRIYPVLLEIYSQSLPKGYGNYPFDATRWEHRQYALRSDTIRGPHSTQYCMEDPEQAFVEYASSRTDKARAQFFKKLLLQPFISAIKSYSFRLFSSLFQLAIYSGVVSPLATRKLNRIDMPLPVAVCSGLVNPLAPRKGKFHGGLITISTLCT
ncbi:hypothetical protein Tco_1125375 [Tanacetum coccineum]|uniref:Uncharacterized protein n=1 Tax=Tanacetum coccineum TaxID=301880 RepID=A0ABQ5JAI0_9ASTR